MFSPINVFNLVINDKFAIKIWDWFLLTLNKRLTIQASWMFNQHHIKKKMREAEAKLMD